jgi:hypothetical protein
MMYELTSLVPIDDPSHGDKIAANDAKFIQQKR